MSRPRHDSTPRQLRVGTQSVAYTLTRANRKTIGITIHPDLRVAVRAPHNMPDDAIEAALQKRARWIVRHLATFADRPAQTPPSTKPQAGTYLFLGRPLSLRIVPLAGSTHRQETVIHSEDTITVWCKNRSDEQRIAALLAQWSRRAAETHFRDRMTALFTKFEAHALTMPQLKLRTMRARWGSCSVKGTITLNAKLIHLDPALIDYVIMHELCHLIEHNHSKAYYALLARMMPDWQARRQQLNATGMPE